MRNIHVNNDDNYATPPKLYDELNKEFNFDFDPCPYNENKITDETDGLLKEWGKSNFVNPPYSRKLKEQFILKAIEEQKKGKTSVFLVPVSTSTRLFHDLIKPNATDIRYLKGRIKFGKRDSDGVFYLPLDKNGKSQSGTKDSMIVVFGLKKIIYVAHPIGGDVENNIKKVIAICTEINLTEPNIIPFVPYLSDLYALDDSKPEERERGLSNCLFMLKKGFIDEIWLYGDRISNGMRSEINICLEVGIKVTPKSIEIRKILWELPQK